MPATETRPTVQPSRPGAAPAPAPVAAPSAAATIDPIKLLLKYKYWLIGAVILGGVIGTAFHVVMSRVHPIWTASAQFLGYPQMTEPGTPVQGDPQNKEGFDRFMQTQVRVIESNLVLARVAENPNLRNEAPRFSEALIEGGRINTSKALKTLGRRVNANILPGTSIIQVSAWDTNPAEATALVKLVREAYIELLRRQAAQVNAPQTDLLTKGVNAISEEVVRLRRTRDDLIISSNLESLQEANNATRTRLEAISREQVVVLADLESGRKQLELYEKEINNPAGVTYPDILRADVERDPLMQQLQVDLNNLDARLKSLLLRFAPEHREVRTIEQLIDAQQRTIDETRENLLRKRFDAEIDRYRTLVAQLEARNGELQNQREENQKRLSDLSRSMAQVKDLDERIKERGDAQARMQEDLDKLRMLDQLPTTIRIVLLQEERKPDEMTFPKLYITGPAGVLILLGLTAAFAVVRELIDQRVKGPADIAMIPRARVLGWVPDAAQDPAGAGATETAYRDRPRGAVAESFRQVRSTLAKRMQPAGHRSVLVLGAAPGSGATTTAVNLGLAWAAADQRVLLIDANFRRPSLHRVFGISESAGLGDVLTQGKALDAAIQKTSTANLDVITAGSREARVFERLGGEAMSRLLAEAKARYDAVLIDCSPAMVSGDGAAIANRADASILVVRAMSEKRGMVARIKNELLDSRGEFLGVVVNGVQPSAGGYIKGNIRATHEYSSEPGAAA